MPTIKRGSSFAANVMFTENEWTGIFPWEEVIAFISQESNRYQLEVEVDEETMMLSITGDTTEWAIGPAKFDIWIIKGDRTIPIPNGYSIEYMVIQGGMTQ